MFPSASRSPHESVSFTVAVVAVTPRVGMPRMETTETIASDTRVPAGTVNPAVPGPERSRMSPWSPISTDHRTSPTSALEIPGWPSHTNTPCGHSTNPPSGIWSWNHGFTREEYGVPNTVVGNIPIERVRFTARSTSSATDAS
jgi:hypothetical protein